MRRILGPDVTGNVTPNVTATALGRVFSAHLAMRRHRERHPAPGVSRPSVLERLPRSDRGSKRNEPRAEQHRGPSGAGGR